MSVGSKLFVGNLAWTLSDADLRDAFSGCVSASIVRDRATNRSRGFGFVEYNSQKEAESAVQSMNGKELGGRALNVSLAREKQDSRR